MTDTGTMTAEQRRYITDPAERDRVLTCAFCGLAYPEGTPSHKHEALAAHIRQCSDHPIGKENRELLAALKQQADRCERAERERELWRAECLASPAAGSPGVPMSPEEVKAWFDARQARIAAGLE